MGLFTRFCKDSHNRHTGEVLPVTHVTGMFLGIVVSIPQERWMLNKPVHSKGGV